MNLEELAHFNQQLAAMLRDGLPLGGALQELAKGLRDGNLRGELTRLEADLAQGVALADAVKRRTFPPLYARLLVAGAKSGDLPGALTLAADHYGELQQRRLRLRTLMVYPALVVVVGLGVTLMLALIQRQTIGGLMSDNNGSRIQMIGICLWLLPAAFVGLGLFGLLVLAVRPLQTWLAWRLPGFRENRLASLAGSIALLLRHGCPLPDAVALVREFERDPKVLAELQNWLARLSRGEAGLGSPPAGRFLPGLFGWLVGGAVGNLSEGFFRAAGFYHRRALHQLDLLLHGVLPLVLVLLGGGIGVQVFWLIQLMTAMIDTLGG